MAVLGQWISLLVVAPLQLLAFFLLTRSVLTGKSTFYTVTWLLAAFIQLVNLFSYLCFTGDPYKTMQMLAGTSALLVMLVYLGHKGKFTTPVPRDRITFLIGLAAIGVWIWKNDAHYANSIIMAAITIAFLPTIIGVWTSGKQENPVPWFSGAASQTMATVVVLLRWDNDPYALVYPLLAILINLSVAIPAMMIRAKTSRL